jgi:replicative DNA helicase
MENSSDNNKYNTLKTKEKSGNIKKVPPHSEQAEKAVLGAMMIDRIAVSKVIEILNQDSFYHPKHQQIYIAISKVFERGYSPDIVSVQEELKIQNQLEFVGGSIYLTDINLETPSAANVEHYARIVQERYLKRLLIETANKISESAFDESTDALDEIDNAEKQIFEIAEKRLRKSYTSIKKLAKETYDMIDMLSKRDSSHFTGVPSGFSELDQLLGGFQRSDLIIIAARPSMGKTALALSIIRNIALFQNLPVAFFSIEMSGVQIVIRLISADSRLDQQKIRTGKINHDENEQIVKSLNRLSNSQIFIDDSPMLSIMELRAKCRRLKAEHKIEIVLVDYLQLITAPKSESREREISFISASLKQIAKELNIPVVALAQLNRSVETRTDKRPMLSDLRESGSIEQDADVVMFVNRPEVYGQTHYDDANKTPTEGTAEIIIGKQRNGPIGNIRLAFLKSCARFDNYASGYEEPPPSRGRDEVYDQPDDDNDVAF